MYLKLNFKILSFSFLGRNHVYSIYNMMDLLHHLLAVLLTIKGNLIGVVVRNVNNYLTSQNGFSGNPIFKTLDSITFELLILVKSLS